MVPNFQVPTIMRSAIPKTSLAQLADSLYRSTDLIYSADMPILCAVISNILIINCTFNIKIPMNICRTFERIAIKPMK